MGLVELDDVPSPRWGMSGVAMGPAVFCFWESDAREIPGLCDLLPEALPSSMRDSSKMMTWKARFG